MCTLAAAARCCSIVRVDHLGESESASRFPCGTPLDSASRIQEGKVDGAIARYRIVRRPDHAQDYSMAAWGFDTWVAGCGSPRGRPETVRPAGGADRIDRGQQRPFPLAVL